MEQWIRVPIILRSVAIKNDSCRRREPVHGMGQRCYVVSTMRVSGV